jgi:hypothetical protein
MAATTEPPQVRRRPSSAWVYGGSLGAFLAVFGALGLGADDSVDAAPAAAKPPAPRQIIVRRVIKRVVIHDAAPVRRGPAPVAISSAPSAPAQSAPAPAPAPLTTQSS